MEFGDAIVLLGIKIVLFILLTVGAVLTITSAALDQPFYITDEEVMGTDVVASFKIGEFCLEANESFTFLNDIRGCLDKEAACSEKVDTFFKNNGYDDNELCTLVKRSKTNRDLLIATAFFVCLAGVVNIIGCVICAELTTYVSVFFVSIAFILILAGSILTAVDKDDIDDSLGVIVQANTPDKIHWEFIRKAPMNLEIAATVFIGLASSISFKKKDESDK